MTSGRLSGPLSGNLSGPKSAPWHSQGWSFSRASAAYAETYDGFLRAVPSGVKPTSELGVLLTRASTQRVSTPMDPTGAAWTSNGMQAAAQVETLSIDRVTPMWRLTANTSNTQHYYGTPSTSKTSGVRYGLACVVKEETAPYLQLGFSNATHGETGYANFRIDDAAGGTAGTGVGTNFRATPLPGGLVLIEFSAPATLTASGRGFVTIVPAANSTRNPSFTGAGESFLFGGLVEFTGSNFLEAWQVADLAATIMTKTVPGITGSFTAYMECFIRDIPADGSRLLSINDNAGTTSNAVEIRTNATGGLYPRIFNSGTGSNGTDEGAPIQNYPKSRRIAFRYDAGAGQGTLFINGVKLTAFSMSLPAGMTTIKLARDQVDASTCTMFVSDFKLERSAWSDNDAINRTSRPAIFPATVSYETSDIRYTTRRFQGLPSVTLNASKTRLWGVWYGTRLPNNSSGEGTGEFCILGRSDDLGVTCTGELAYLLPANKNVYLCADPRIWRAPDGRVWVLYNQAGSAVIQDGQFGIWAVEVLNPEAAAAPIFGRHYRLLDWGWCSRPFLAGGEVYVPVSQWRGPSGMPPVKPGLPSAAKRIYKWNFTTMQLEFHSGLPSGSNWSFDETAVVDNGDGTWHSVWRTTAGLEQSTWNGTSWGSASSWTDITPTADSRAAYQRSPYSGRRVIVINKSTPPARSNATIAVYHSGSWHQFTWDTRSNISYFDMDCDDSGNWYIWYDFERTTLVGSGARAVEAVVINEDAVVAGTASTTIRTMSVPVGP